MQINNIPQQLLDYTKSNEDVNILIGDNGSGKSQLLCQLALHFQNNNTRIIVIANSIHDKFKISGKNIFALRDREGRRNSNVAVRKTLLNVSNEGISRLKNASMALEHAKFDPVIGIKISLLSTENIRSLTDNYSVSIEDREDIESLIYKLPNNVVNNIIWVRMTDFSFGEINQSTFARLVKHERILRQHKIIKKLEYFLSRNNYPIPLLNASSGELSIITSLIFIATTIDENTVILIDEPENSLHPKWQKDYVKIFLDNFHRYQPKIFIATHSPLILNGAEITSKNIKVFKASNLQFTLINNHSNNIEAAFADYFDVITPANKILSQRIMTMTNELVENKISKDVFNEKIDKLEDLVYDEKQKKALENFKHLGEKIDHAKQK